MKCVNSISIDRDNFKSREEWEDAVKRIVFSLLENRQIMTVSARDFGLGLIDIEFNPDDLSLCYHYPYWLSPNEEGSVVYEYDKEDNV